MGVEAYKSNIKCMIYLVPEYVPEGRVNQTGLVR